MFHYVRGPPQLFLLQNTKYLWRNTNMHKKKIINFIRRRLCIFFSLNSTGINGRSLSNNYMPIIRLANKTIQCIEPNCLYDYFFQHYDLIYYDIFKESLVDVDEINPLNCLDLILNNPHVLDYSYTSRMLYAFFTMAEFNSEMRWREIILWLIYCHKYNLKRI